MKLIVLVRHPLERAWSSYKYNYLEGYDPSKGPPVPFFDFLSSELEYLKGPCLAGDSGKSSIAAFAAAGSNYGGAARGRPQFNVVQGCYEYPAAAAERTSLTFPGWSKLLTADPRANANAKNSYLHSAMIGRSLYSYQIAWYAASFAPESILVVCTERLKENAAETMGEIGDFLGLPAGEADWESITAVGMFNVGGDKEGFTEATGWEEAKERDTAGEIGKDARELMREVVREERERLNGMREEGMFMGRDCEWE